MSLRWVTRAVDQMATRVRTSNSTWNACVSNASEITRASTAQGITSYSTSTLGGLRQLGTSTNSINVPAFVSQYRQIYMRSSQFSAAADDSTTAERNPLSQTPVMPASSEGEVPDVTTSRQGHGKARAFLRNAAISPRKLKQACDLVRFLPVEHALIQCQLSPKKACAIAYKVIKSAEANAINNHGLDKEKLVVGKIKADKGEYIKRLDFKARGRTGMLNKYRAHLEVVLEEVEDVLAKVPEDKRMTVRKDYGPRKHRKYSDAHGPAKLWV